MGTGLFVDSTVAIIEVLPNESHETMISVMRDVFVQETTFASLSARYQREKSSLFASTP
jgi:hypothetical protein